ncbi:MAG TPA: hypothetical protein VNJ08_15115 [Bacteriovoracaceae bacterium]|nr:hypothetical protein [Bacteriovoracaceae bacterium]
MEKFSLGKKAICYLLVMSFISSGCMPSDVPSSPKKTFNTTGTKSNGGPSNFANGDATAAPAAIVIPPKVEIRHLIEPNLSTDLNYSPGTGISGGGSYVRKLTLPKNFQGRLYVAGINIGTLADKHVRVRFKFGVNREPVTIPATVSQAPGITPSTGINVLVLDLRAEPFRNVRLGYDLFDYNEYAPGVEPTQDNRNTSLYCRGLRVEDDPTFIGVGSCDGVESNPSQPAEECLYAYAKVLDQGLVQVSNLQEVPLLPSLGQAKSVAGLNYFMDSMLQQLKKPLRDTIPVSSVNVMGNYNFSQVAVPAGSSDSVNINFNGTSAWNSVNILGGTYFYRGPYRLMNQGEWQFKFDDLDGEKRLFKEDKFVFKTPTEKIYYNSYLFPLAAKMDLQANVTHLSSDTFDGVRVENTLSVAGKTKWMDGANARAISKNADLEHMGSCNVSSTIEIIAKDTNGNDFIIALANDVKIQLVRPSQHRTDTGNEVLFTNFKTCNSNAGCGGNECCFNSRCWDHNLVSQCIDSTASQANRIIGETCNTDLECTSLCCNRTSGLCAPHNSLISPQVLCSKPVGDFCIAREWCQKTTVTRCMIIKTGVDPLGATTCRQHCYSTQEFGDCQAGVCVPPPQDLVPIFDPNDPNVCNDAIPIPKF